MLNVWNVTKKMSKTMTGLRVVSTAMLAATAVLALACNTTETPPADMGNTMFTCCGKAGDPGNEQGVGKYCTTMAECTGANTLCSAVAAAAKRTFFCTKPCQGDGGSVECGTGATCTFDSSFNAHGCVPNTCLANIPAGCSL